MWFVFLVALLVVVVAVLLWGEILHARSSRRRMGASAHVGGSEAVVVLGYRNPGTHANYVNRYRVRIGIRSRDPRGSKSTLVLCGGSRFATIPEAKLMADYARDALQYTGPMIMEPNSRTTWENIQNAIPLIEESDVIKIVSNSLHAEKGRAYLWKLRPDLAERLVPGKDYRFGEIILAKPAAAVIGLKGLRKLNRSSVR